MKDNMKNKKYHYTPYSEKKRVLVTGGAGFLGSHLCEALLKNKCYVICLDNLFTGKKENIQQLLSNPDFEFIRHDIIEPINLEVDEIYNLACPASPVHYQYNPIKTIKTNVLGALNMLGLAKRVKAKILQASTSEIYGDPEVHPQIEEYWGNVNTIGERSCYDEGKRVAESLFMNYHRMNGVDTRIVRIFNTYGPRMLENDGRVVSNFICQAIKNKNITIYGDGSQTRSFCYVDDLIKGMQKLMEVDYHLPVNLGNPEEYTIKQLAEKVIHITNSSSSLINKPLPKDDPTKRKPDISKAEKLINWCPEVKLEKGLKKTIEYFEKFILDS